MQDPSISVRVAYFFIARTCTFTFLYGVFVLLFLQSVTVYLTRKRPNHRQHWMFLTTIVTFTLATVNEVTVILEMVTFVHSAFSGDQNVNPIEKYHKALGMMTKPNIVYQLVSPFEILISDCVIVWRAFVLLQYRRWLIVMPLLPLTCSFALVLVFLSYLSNYAAIGLNQVENILSSVIVTLSFVTNVIATALISHVYCSYRREMEPVIGVRQVTQAEKILALLIESGVIFCLLQSIAVIVCYLPPAPGRPESDTPESYAYAIILAIYYGVSAMYPTAIFTLISSHRTLDQMYTVTSHRDSRSHSVVLSSAVTFTDLNFTFSSPITSTIENSEAAITGKD